MWMESPASTVFATFSRPAISRSPREARTPPQAETVGGLGNRKNALIKKVIEDIGVEPYEGSVRLIHHLRRHGFKIAVVTSSVNAGSKMHRLAGVKMHQAR